MRLIIALAVLASSAETSAGTFGGVEFPQGAASFADCVLHFQLGSGYNPPNMTDPSNALGVPDWNGLAAERATGVVALGTGGQITVEFRDNALIGSGDAGLDLWIFEVGLDEEVEVELSNDKVTWIWVGRTSGGKSGIDIDAFGVGVADAFRFVRLTDLISQGTSNGAEIDAIGAISSVRIPVSVIQLTDRGGNGGPCDTCCQLIHRQPILSPQGDQFTFGSTWNRDDSTGNPNTNRHTEVFLYDLVTGTVTQATQTREGISVPFDFAGATIAFLSSSPEVPANEDRNADLFLADVALTGSLQTITTTTGPGSIDHGLGNTCPSPWFAGEDWPTVANLHADLSSDEGSCVWASNRNIPSKEAPKGANTDQNYEIYLEDVPSGITRQLTQTSGGDDEALAAGANLWPRVSTGGSRVVFVSNRDLGGPPLGAGRYALFWIDGAGSLQRLTSAELHVEREFPAFGMNDAGTRVVFASDADLTGENADGNAEIFAVALPSGTVMQITDTTAEVANSRPILSGDGLKLAFLSNADLGRFRENDDGSQELWVFHFDEDRTFFNPFVQVTNLPETPDPSSDRTHWMDWYSMDRDGSQLVMCTNGDLTGGNTEHAYEIFLATFDWGPMTMVKITAVDRLAGRYVALEWECSVPDLRFTVEWSGSLQPGSWQPVPPTDQWPVKSTVWVSGAPILDDHKYFRVRSE